MRLWYPAKNFAPISSVQCAQSLLEGALSKVYISSTRSIFNAESVEKRVVRIMSKLAIRSHATLAECGFRLCNVSILWPFARWRSRRPPPQTPAQRQHRTSVAFACLETLVGLTYCTEKCVWMFVCVSSNRIICPILNWSHPYPKRLSAGWCAPPMWVCVCVLCVSINRIAIGEWCQKLWPPSRWILCTPNWSFICSAVILTAKV